MNDSKMDNLIISGFNVQYKSYARSVSTHGVDDYTKTNSETETIESEVVELPKNKDVSIYSSDISICHPLKSKHATNMKPSIVVKLKSCKAKQKIICNARKLKGSFVYIMNILQDTMQILPEREYK